MSNLCNASSYHMQQGVLFFFSSGVVVALEKTTNKQKLPCAVLASYLMLSMVDLELGGTTGILKGRLSWKNKKSLKKILNDAMASPESSKKF